MDTQPAKVKEVTDNTVIISFQDKEIVWPNEHMRTVKKGDEVYVAVMSSKDILEHKNDIAKSLLNSVMNPKK